MKLTKKALKELADEVARAIERDGRCLVQLIRGDGLVTRNMEFSRSDVKSK